MREQESARRPRPVRNEGRIQRVRGEKLLVLEDGERKPWPPWCEVRPSGRLGPGNLQSTTQPNVGSPPRRRGPPPAVGAARANFKDAGPSAVAGEVAQLGREHSAWRPTDWAFARCALALVGELLLHGIDIVEQRVADRHDHRWSACPRTSWNERRGRSVWRNVLGHRRVRDQPLGVPEPLRQITRSESRRDLTQVGPVHDLGAPVGLNWPSEWH